MRLTEKGFYQFARRYFVKNGFDGALTILGIVLGSMISGVATPKTVLLVGFSACIGMGVSGLWGTFLTEQAERTRKRHELERMMLISLAHTSRTKAHRKQAIMLAAIDGLSPFLTATVMLMPFFFAGQIGMQNAYYASLSITATILFGLGAFLGHISKTSAVRMGAIMMFAGVVAAAINLVLAFV